MDFYKRVELVCQKVPYGRVASYGQIALLCGAPKNARQVGYALRHHKSGDVPAYRIVNHKGVLSGAFAFEEANLQRILLEGEGIRVNREDNKVDLKKYGWKNTMEESLELRSLFQNMKI